MKLTNDAKTYIHYLFTLNYKLALHVLAAVCEDDKQIDVNALMQIGQRMLARTEADAEYADFIAVNGDEQQLVVGGRIRLQVLGVQQLGQPQIAAVGQLGTLFSEGDELLRGIALHEPHGSDVLSDNDSDRLRAGHGGVRVRGDG